MKTNAHKTIYASLMVKKVPFTMFKENNNDVFTFGNNKIVLLEESITVNGTNYNDVNDVVKFIKNY